MASATLEKQDRELISDRTQTNAISVFDKAGTDYSDIADLGTFITSIKFGHNGQSYRCYLFKSSFEGRTVFFWACLRPRAVAWGYSEQEALRAFEKAFLEAIQPATVKWLKDGSQKFHALCGAMPGELVRLVELGNLSTTDLCRAIDALGSCEHGFVTRTLMQLLDDERAVVREAAVEALFRHDLSQNQVEKLRHMLDHDPSSGVRHAIENNFE